jgi:thiol-disulfide isomerase/thioredoxin
MNRNQFAALCLGAAAVIGAGVWFLGQGAQTDRGQRVGSPPDGSRLPLTPDVTDAQPQPATINLPTFWATKLPDLDGNLQSVSKWQGKFLVVNFWATWCTPCREEMPVFSELQQKYSAKNIQFIGIAADSADKVRDFQRRFPVIYPLLPADTQGLELSKRLGNRIGVLPHSVILNERGDVVLNRVGPLKKADLEKIFDENR